jgi:predicted permease
MAGLLQDVRYALRQLRKSPGFALAAVLMLGLGICANSTIFSWIDGTMLHPIPAARDTGNLVSVMRGTPSTSPAPPLSYPDYRDFCDRNHSFTGILAYHHDWLALTGGATPERIYVSNVSANFFDVLGVRPFMGRFFLPEEESREGGVPYIVLSYALWQTRFAADSAILGKSVELAQRPFTVIGVAPEGFINSMPGVREDAWLPLEPGIHDGRMRQRESSFLNVMGRLRPGMSRQRATEDLETLMRRIVAEYPNEHPGVNTITLDPLWRSPFSANVFLAASLPILLSIAGVVLLLTCANVATLALVRFVSRRREVSIRQSLGAGRLELMRQMIIEGLIVSLVGGALALLLTSWTAKTLALFIPPNSNPIVLNGALGHNVIFGILLLALLASAICGALPAWRSSRVSPAEVLKEEAGSVSSGSHNRRLLSGLVVAQIALSLALLVTSGLFLRTLRNMSDANPGFDQNHVLTASVGLGIAGYPPNEENAIQHKILERVSALPGVTVASLTDWLPLSFNGRSDSAYPEGYVPQLHESVEVRRADVTPGFFDVMGMTIVAGRDFTRDDNETAPRVVIVDQTAANHYWPGQNPLGRRLNIGGPSYIVVGVAKNTKHQFMNERPEPMIYLSFFQNSYETTVQVRTQGDPNSMASSVEQAIHQVDARIPVFDVRSLRETTQISSTFAVMESTFAMIFALIALVLAATGIYGVVAYRTQLRTHEIGIRVALGASRSDVMRLVFNQGLRLTALGLALGLILALGLTRFLAGLLYGITATDPTTVVSVVALLALIAVLACCLPAIRATRLNPVNAMRE